MSATPSAPPASSEVDPLLGRVLHSRYKIVEVLGQGGMGRVYKAVQAPLDRVVALKVLGAGHDRDPSFHKRFFLEAAVTAKLTHPNSITLYDYGRSEDGIFFIAMEYLAGRTLSAALQQEGPLSQERVIHIAQQICRALREAHGLGIIHRDLKPANVMLLRQQDDHDFVKVLDFGLVKFFSGDKAEDELTNAGTFMGSPHYIAPEQARNQGPDQRCDIYSLGVLLYHMLTGKVPFTAANPVDIILKHLHDAPVPLGELVADLDPELEDVVLRCLAKDRAERFQSMDELLARLKDVRARISGSSGPHTFPPDPLRNPSAAHAVPHTPSALRTPSRALPTIVQQSGAQALRPVLGPRDALEQSAMHATVDLPASRRFPALLVVAPALAIAGAVAVALFWPRSHTEPAPLSPVAAPPVEAEASPPQVAMAAPAAAPAAVPTSLTVVAISSTPENALVRDAEGRFVGTTPLELRLPVGKPYFFTLRRDGYQSITLQGKASGVRISIAETLRLLKADSSERAARKAR